MDTYQSVDQNLFLQNYGTRTHCFTSGRGCFLVDAEGREYLDMTSGIGVTALGHAHPRLQEAIQSQVSQYSHISNLFLSPAQQELVKKLVAFTGFPKVFLCNSGTEAVEAGIKFARKFHFHRDSRGRDRIVSFAHSFHGRTYGALAATGQESLKKGFGPMLPGFETVAFNDSQALRSIDATSIAAIVFEPVQGEGGVIPMDQEFADTLGGLQSQGTLLIADEIQAGLGRCGVPVLSHEYGLKPDLLLLAKPLGGGLPLGAVLLQTEVAACVAPGDHGSTFGGNPLSCAAGAAFLAEMQRDGFLESIRECGSYLFQEVAGMVGRLQKKGIDCGLPRGRGMMLGLPYGGDLPALLARAREEKLLVLRAGKDVVRLLPPLIATLPEIDLAITRLERAMLH